MRYPVGRLDNHCIGGQQKYRDEDEQTSCRADQVSQQSFAEARMQPESVDVHYRIRGKDRTVDRQIVRQKKYRDGSSPQQIRPKMPAMIYEHEYTDGHDRKYIGRP